jgi:hypothetical protein
MWRYDLRSNVAALPMPVLSIGGTADRVNPYFVRTVEHLPEAEHVELAGADDFLAERDPARLGALLRRFFDLPRAEVLTGRPCRLTGFAGRNSVPLEERPSGSSPRTRGRPP